MKDEVLPIIPLSCIQAVGCRVSAHLEEPRAGGGRVFSLDHRWSTRRSLPFKKK
ncbi:hypothetical protein Hanom_Chr11g01016461 [Helianthus anomalus]